MKYFSITLCVAVFSAVGLYAQTPASPYEAGFSADITTRVADDHGQQQVEHCRVYYEKDKGRIESSDVSDGAGTMIYRLDRNVAWMVMPE